MQGIIFLKNAKTGWRKPSGFFYNLLLTYGPPY